jgi:hypothetical protein
MKGWQDGEMADGRMAELQDDRMKGWQDGGMAE